MQRVGIHLQVQALVKVDAQERDYFGRSAYNRYYYATFNCAKLLVTQLDAKWAKTPHAVFPSLLATTIVSELEKGRSQAAKLGDFQLVTLCNQAKASSHALAKLMTEAYAVRVIADYSLETAIVFGTGQRFELNRIDITDAHQWPSKAAALSKVIADAWKQVHV